MDIYSHELSAYKLEIQSIKDDLEELKSDPSVVENITHFGLGISNRGHLILIGLCSLVEIYLYELARTEEQQQLFKFKDINGQGIKKLKCYLSRTKKVDFGKLKHWPAFNDIYTIRNTFVHSYGGLMETSQLKEAKESLERMQMESSLVGDRRMRLNNENLLTVHGHIESLIFELKTQA